MSNDLKDILGNSNKDINNQQLMDYLSNQLNKTQLHELEKTMADDAFINDAVEGLQQVKGEQNLQAYLDQLNNSLQKQIAKNKQRKEKRRLKDSPFTYFAIVLVLLLIIIGVIMVKRYRGIQKQKAIPATSVTVSYGKVIAPYQAGASQKNCTTF